MPELYLITAPEQAQSAARWGLPLAHMAYGLGREQLQLTVGALSLTTRGGWMVLTDHAMPEHGEIAAFAEQVRQECRRRRYGAVLADFEAPANDHAFDILAALASCGLPLVVPAIYGDALPEASVLVDSAVSGGELEVYLREQLARWQGRVCLALQRLRMRFPLPCPTGEGEALDESTLRTLLEGRQSYFSRELGCRYCTCREGDAFTFLLFDDGASLRHKLLLAEQLGIRTAVALYPEICDVLPELISLGHEAKQLNR